MRQSSIVLLSGGLDSTAAFYWAYKNTDLVQAVTFDYGQKAGAAEIKSAEALCKKLDVRHKIIQLPWYHSLGQSALLSKEGFIPEPKLDQLDSLEESLKTARAVWVPNRNGVLLNIAAAIAEAMVVQQVIVGFNREEGVTFKDNSIPFIESINDALAFSTLDRVEILAPFSNLDKTEIVKWMLQHQHDLTGLWSCYREGDQMCGTCESCQRLKRALSANQESVLVKQLFNN